MIGQLTHASEEGEDVAIIVEHRSLIEVSREFAGGIGIERLVEIFFLLVEQITSYLDRTRWQSHIVRAFEFGTTQHHTFEQQTETLERVSAFAHLGTVVLDRFEDLVVPETDVVHRCVATAVAVAPVRKGPVQRLAVATFAVIESC